MDYEHGHRRSPRCEGWGLLNGGMEYRSECDRLPVCVGEALEDLVGGAKLVLLVPLVVRILLAAQ
jgi:hypothetical protein